MTFKKSILLVTAGICFVYINAIAQSKTNLNDRQLWLNYMDKIAQPVLKNLAENTLKANMPVVLSKTIDNAESRSKVAYLEAFGRTLSGIAPWLQLEGG